MAKQIFEKRMSFLFKFFLALFVFIITFFAAVLFGAVDTTLTDLWLALHPGETGKVVSIIQDLRLPREIAAVFVGGALATSGAIMQGITRNPLAEPGLLGLTAGANAFLAITIAFFPYINYFGIMIACFIGALIGMVLVFSISALKKGGLSPFRIVLAGAAVSAFLYAIEQGIGLYFKVSKDVSMWTAGGLIGTTWGQLKMIAPFVLFGILFATLLSRHLTIISLDEEVAVGLGQRIVRIKILLFAVVIMLAGIAVALVGKISFVGLMIPHIVRAFVGTDYRYILPMAAVTGATFMLLADTIARTINAPYETPIIAIVAVLGLPFFLIIVRKGGRTFS